MGLSTDTDSFPCASNIHTFNTDPSRTSPVFHGLFSIVVIYCEHTYSLFPPLKHISYFYDDWSILKAEVNNSLCISSRNNRWSDIKVRRKQHVYITTPFMPVFLFLVESGTDERRV